MPWNIELTPKRKLIMASIIDVVLFATILVALVVNSFQYKGTNLQVLMVSIILGSALAWCAIIAIQILFFCRDGETIGQKIIGMLVPYFPPVKTILSPEISELLSSEMQQNIDTFLERFAPNNVDPLFLGICAKKVPEELSKTIIDTFKEPLRKKGYYIFRTNYDSTYVRSVGFIHFYDVAIIRSSDQFDILRSVRTWAPNFNLTNEAIIEELKKWEVDTPFIITAADDDGMTAEFITKPKDLYAFATRLKKFCPDMIDPSISAYVQKYHDADSFSLWWD